MNVRGTYAHIALRARMCDARGTPTPRRLPPAPLDTLWHRAGFFPNWSVSVYPTLRHGGLDELARNMQQGAFAIPRCRVPLGPARAGMVGAVVGPRGALRPT